MSDNLDKYLPEFDEDEIRNKLADLIAEQLKDMLVSSYKLRRVIAKMLDQEMNKLRRMKKSLRSLQVSPKCQVFQPQMIFAV